MSYLSRAKILAEILKLAAEAREILVHTTDAARDKDRRIQELEAEIARLKKGT